LELLDEEAFPIMHFKISVVFYMLFLFIILIFNSPSVV